MLGMASAEASVLQHRFGATPPFTVGVEEEFMLLDPDTMELVQRTGQVLAAEEGGEFVEYLSPELFESVLEAHTAVCRDTAQLDRELRRLRAHVADAAGAQGLLFASAGTHPFSLFERQRITPRDRYRGVIEELQYAARRELNFGLHVHVAVDSADKVIAVGESLLPHLPELIALSSSSPFWRGEPTGVASSRQLIFATMPRTGPPPRFESYDDYVSVIRTLEQTGCLADYTHIWWDIRPHPRLGTIEVRVMDAVSPVEDAVALAAYVQALVKLYADRFEAEGTFPRFHRALVGENRWRACRFGLGAELIDLEDGEMTRTPVALLVRRTLKRIEPHARELGSERELEGVERILRTGNGAMRQLHVYGANRDIVEVTRDLAEASAARLGGDTDRPDRATPGRP
jgi:glutamate---cysteine ligase / carboxylate-amine ligase